MADNAAAEEENEGKITVNKWDCNAVKNTIDDAIRKIASERWEYTEKTTLEYGRLAISTLAVGIAGFALLWDYLHPFPVSRPVLAACACTYFLLMGALQLYIWYIECGVFHVAVDEDPTGRTETASYYFSSTMKKYDPMYTLEIRMKKKSEMGVAELQKSVESWIDQEGTLLYDELAKDVTNLHKKLIAKKHN